MEGGLEELEVKPAKMGVQGKMNREAGKNEES